MKKEYNYPIFPRIISNIFLSIIILFGLFFLLIFLCAIFKGLIVISKSILFYLILISLVLIVLLIQIISYPNIIVKDKTLFYKPLYKWVQLEKTSLLSYKIIKTIINIGIPHKGEILFIKYRSGILPKYLIITNSITNYTELYQFIIKEYFDQ